MRNYYIEEFKAINYRMVNEIDFLDYADDISEACQEIYGEDWGYVIDSDKFYLIHSGKERSTLEQVKRLNEVLCSFAEIKKYSSPYWPEDFPAVVRCYDNCLSMDKSIVWLIMNDAWLGDIIKSKDGKVQRIVGFLGGEDRHCGTVDTYIEKYAFKYSEMYDKIDLTQYAQVISDACYDVIGDVGVCIAPHSFYIARDTKPSWSYVHERYLNKVLFAQPEIEACGCMYNSEFQPIGVVVTESLFIDYELGEWIHDFYFGKGQTEWDEELF